MKKNSIFWGGMLAVVMGFSGCSPLGIQVKTQSRSAIAGEGGVYRSGDGGIHFEQSSYIRTVNGVKETIGYANIRFLVADPVDHRTVYALADDGTAWVSYAFGDTWNKIFSSTRRVEALAVAPSDRSRLYLAGGRSIMMSLDAGSNWERIYHDPSMETVITALAVDYVNPKIMYAGTGQGTILQTRDGGETWFVPIRLSEFGAGGRVHKIVTVNGDPSKLYAVVVDGLQMAGSVYISRDQGKSWSRNAALAGLVRSSKYGDFERDIRSGILYYASLYGIFKSDNEGDTWEQLSLLTEARSSMIYTLAIDPQKSDHIIYTTASNSVISENGGKEWKSVALPSFGNRVPRDMIISQNVSADVLLGVGAQY